MSIFDSIILGIVEGITEFLPISSTAHLILASKLIGLEESQSLKSYEVIIQLGAILAVVFIYKDKILNNFSLWVKLLIAFVPTGFFGLFFYKYIKNTFTPEFSVWFMMFSGFVFILVEKFYKQDKNHINELSKVTYIKSVQVGFTQVIALLPGISRSGATIIGGLLLGLKREVAVEFSFLLAIPTMLVATGYDIVKNVGTSSLESFDVLAVGFIVSFFASFVAVKWFLHYISKYSFVPFGVYLILSGIIFKVAVL